MRIVFCGNTFPAAREILRARLPQDEIAVCSDLSTLGAVDVAIPLMSRIDASLMDVGRFRLIQQWGAGTEGVDLRAALERGIAVANVPASGGNADSVAELMILLTIALLRNLPAAETNVKSAVLGYPLGKTLSSRTVCLFGLGAIAKALAQRLRPFGVRLLGVTRDPSAEKVQDYGLDACFSVADLRVCLSQTDILMICTRLADATRGVIDRSALEALLPGSYLINAARGAIVDYDALYAALKSGHLAGAGLDVYWNEPISPGDPLLALPNVIATPHIGGVTDRSYAEIGDAVAANINRLRQGETLLNRVLP